MKDYTRSIQFFALSTILVVFAACVSDVDFDKVEEIVLTPRVDADLVFFTIDNTDFENGEVIDLQTVVRDTTRLEFLDDTVTQENLKEIELRYIVENSFSLPIMSRSLFLDEAGEVQYEVSFPLNASSSGEPEITEFVEVISEQNLEGIRNSIQLVSEIVLTASGQSIEGELSLQSKALYSLEFSDL